MVTAISPADPMFWLHHANVDRIWAIWQQKNPTKNPNIKNLPDEMKVLMPFGVPIEHGLSIPAIFCYRYD